MTILPEAKGKTALVTGASRGIGRALAKGLAEAGFDVAVTDLSSQAAELAVTRAEIEAAGRKAYVYTMDVGKKREIEVTAQALLAGGRLPSTCWSTMPCNAAAADWTSTSRACSCLTAAAARLA